MDCGGQFCHPCQNGQGCYEDSDCVSHICQITSINAHYATNGYAGKGAGRGTCATASPTPTPTIAPTPAMCDICKETGPCYAACHNCLGFGNAGTCSACYEEHDGFACLYADGHGCAQCWTEEGDGDGESTVPTDPPSPTCDDDELTFQTCASSCIDTCEDPDPTCTHHCVPRCACPPEKPIWLGLGTTKCVSTCGGVTLPPGVSNPIPNDPPTCTHGTMYNICGSVCTRTCHDKHPMLNNPMCGECEPRCECPSHKPLWTGAECIEVDACTTGSQLTHQPTKTPTRAPTPHPCDDESHGCYKGEGGICCKFFDLL